MLFDIVDFVLSGNCFYELVDKGRDPNNNGEYGLENTPNKPKSKSSNNRDGEKGLHISKKFPTEGKAETKAKVKHISNEVGTVSLRNDPDEKDAENNANNSGFYELAASINQGGFVFLLSLIFLALGLLLLVSLNLGGTAIA